MKISFIGAGNVAWHLSQALETANYDIETVYSRNPSNARALTQQLYNAQVHRGLDFLDSNSEIFFLCVSDDAMEEVIRNLSLPSGAILVHTSGSKTLNELQELVDVYLDETIRTGVFYPLQTFTKMFHVNFSEIPICLESSNLDVENLLITLAQSISDVTYAVNSEERKRIHLAAVYACNFTNHLWGIAQDLMKKNDLEFKLLEPLIKETLRKALESEDIFAVQTGPARRNDQKIIQRQIGSLKDHTGYKKIYESITEDIIDKKYDMIDAQKLQKITTFVFDIDGVMTDGAVHVLETGEHYRTFYIRDGYALERAIQAGYHICVITGGKHEGVRKRLQNLKIQDVFMGSGGKSKLEIYTQWLEDSGISEDEILYMGDDIPDYQVMSRENLYATCPADACEEILGVSQYVSPHNGGRGAVRDIIEQVMRAQEKWLVF